MTSEFIEATSSGVAVGALRINTYPFFRKLATWLLNVDEYPAALINHPLTNQIPTLGQSLTFRSLLQVYWSIN